VVDLQLRGNILRRVERKQEMISYSGEVCHSFDSSFAVGNDDVWKRSEW
jgi:hypothetical protein